MTGGDAQAYRHARLRHWHVQGPPCGVQADRANGMDQDLSWELAAERYEQKLIEAKYSW